MRPPHDATAPDLELARARALAALRKKRARVARRAAAIDADLARIADAGELARLAAYAAPEAGRVPRGARSMHVIDYASDDARTVEIPLDPSKPARDQLEAIFRNARRLRGGEPKVVARRDATRGELEALDAAAARVTEAPDVDALDAAAGSLLPRPPSASAPARPQQPKPPYRSFEASGGPVLVGRGARHNDELTFQVARPYHLWLHARGVPGAHVIAPIPRNKPCPPDRLVDAAHLAAHFSDARGEPVVEVSYALRKHVRKPRGAAPGAVVVEKEKVLVLRVEEARMKRLLEHEVQKE